MKDAYIEQLLQNQLVIMKLLLFQPERNTTPETRNAVAVEIKKTEKLFEGIPE